MINKIEAQKVAELARRYLPLSRAELTDEYFYQSVPLCLMDAVYSIGVQYNQVQRVVDRYCSYFSLEKTRESRQVLPLPNTQESITEFLKQMQDVGFETFASDIFCNKQRTSTTNGILKAEAIFKFATVLKSHNVDYLQDVPTRINDVELEYEIKRISGQGKGTSLRYFFMLSGSENLIKPDRMIQRFLERVLQRSVRVEESQHLLSEAVTELKPDYPNMTPRLLDNLIWQYQRQQKKSSLMEAGSTTLRSSGQSRKLGRATKNTYCR